ncbi:MAG: universal stress protein [Dehalococcoidia bacterium]
MKMLVPLDGSEFAEEVLGPASELAKLSQAEVILVEVVRRAVARDAAAPAAPIQPALGYGLWGGDVPEDREDYLKEVAVRYFPAGARWRVLLGEDPAQEILACAREEQVDLIALATHGRSGLARMVLGSVADKLVKSGVVNQFLLVRPRKLGYTDR